MKGRHKKFHYGKDTISKWDAARKFPDPAFFERPSASMTPDELREMLSRNIAEIEHCIEAFMRPYANGRIRGRPTKAHIMHNINKLHDWRVSLSIMGGERGRPYLWEE